MKIKEYLSKLSAEEKLDLIIKSRDRRIGGKAQVLLENIENGEIDLEGFDNVGKVDYKQVTGITFRELRRQVFLLKRV